LSDNFISIKFLNKDYLIVRTEQDLTGIVGIDGEIIIDAKYKKIEFLANKFFVAMNQGEPIQIFNLEGNEILLDQEIIHKRGIVFRKFVHMEINPECTLFVYPTASGEFIFDEDFIFLGKTESYEDKVKLYAKSSDRYRFVREEYIDFINQKVEDKANHYLWMDKGKDFTPIVDLNKNKLFEDLIVYKQLSNDVFVVKNNDLFSIIQIIKK